jgi:hypothetical protein
VELTPHHPFNFTQGINMSVQHTAVTRAITLLNAAGAQYKIIMADGTEFGELQAVVVPTKPKAGSKYGWGVLTKHVSNFLDDVVVGQVGVVEYAPLDPLDARQAIASYAFRNWGKASWIIEDKGDRAEVLRVL